MRAVAIADTATDSDLEALVGAFDAFVRAAKRARARAESSAPRCSGR